ncbi:hypothetical protein [Acidiferrobacter sp. SPIII_3]|uniref:hypothetical protein n=1 Tax=Acidiferrobacter sp. SPIII_3 TaxID=1281578 RepID=UPI0011AB5960|nr:hypothetical protein [Acidiferrobacter sp. SPIII_3]
MAIPLLAGCELAGRDITADALLTQRALAEHIVRQGAHYHFTVKGNQPAPAVLNVGMIVNTGSRP